jgi:hypothetical protein
MTRLRFVAPLAVALLYAGCSNGKADANGAAVAAEKTVSAAPEDLSGVKAPDACTFISRAELESVVGWELREGKTKDAVPGEFECDFTHPPAAYVTRTFPNPAVPETAGFSSVKIHTNPVSASQFAEFRKEIGARGEDVAGIGDGAYFYGINLIYVRVGNKGFSVRMYIDPQTDADRAAIKNSMLALAKLGASKLS